MKREDIKIEIEAFKNVPTIDAYLYYVHYVDETTVTLGYIFIDSDGAASYDKANFDNSSSTMKMIKNDLLETYKHIIEIHDDRLYHYIKERIFQLYEDKKQLIRLLISSVIFLSGPIMASYSAFHLPEDKRLYSALIATGLVLTAIDGFLFSHMMNSLSYIKSQEDEINNYIELEAKQRIRKNKGEFNEEENAD